ncbi:MAG: hypothetical protein JWN32_1352 [Solirubrobacterales bacterium]|nr:hypothetical protein [Solirubrobacterales bacterium]
MSDSRVVVGLVAPTPDARELAAELAEELPEELARRFPGHEWRIVVDEADPAEPSASSDELVDRVRRLMLEEGWQIGIGLTDIPLRTRRRPVSAFASPSHGVALVSVPAFGAIGRKRRVKRAIAHVIEGVLGEPVAERGRTDADATRLRIARRLRELSSPLAHARRHEDGTVKFMAATVVGNLRLLVGMVRANQPSRVIVRLSRALVGALGTGAASLATANIWELADAMAWPRLVAAGVASVVATCTALVIAHHLWERAAAPEARERVMLFNFATCATLTLGVLSLYAALFVITAAAAGSLIPPHLLGQKIGHGAGVGDYLRLAWLVASLATIGGALGSLVESDAAVRAAAYTNWDDVRTESAED